MCGDNHNRVADLDGILPAGDDDRAVTVDKGNQQPFLQSANGVFVTLDSVPTRNSMASTRESNIW